MFCQKYRCSAPYINALRILFGCDENGVRYRCGLFSFWNVLVCIVPSSMIVMVRSRKSTASFGSSVFQVSCLPIGPKLSMAAETFWRMSGVFSTMINASSINLR